MMRAKNAMRPESCADLVRQCRKRRTPAFGRGLVENRGFLRHEYRAKLLYSPTPATFLYLRSFPIQSLKTPPDDCNGPHQEVQGHEVD
jgi:hypothetical protein